MIVGSLEFLLKLFDSPLEGFDLNERGHSLFSLRDAIQRFTERPCGAFNIELSLLAAKNVNLEVWFLLH
jgi:hypothetical protein